jgi:5-methylcytosine-specific restriction endonuclease McrA
MAKKKSRSNRPKIYKRDLENGKIEEVSFVHGVFGIKIRSHTPIEIRDANIREWWLRCLDYFRGRCAYCLGKPVRDEILTKDHFIPKSKNGNNGGTNIVPACKFCNEKKDNKNPHIWCTDEQLERIYTYFWDFRIRTHMKKNSNSTIVWKAIGL